jgi:GT2 family glycosyltransferase
LIVLLNNDIEVITGNWLEEMAGYALRTKTGAVGAKLLYPDNTIQHAGIILGINGIAGHGHKHFEKDDLGYFSRLVVASNYAAVTGACLMVRKELFELVGGFTESFEIALNDVDFCLKLYEKGYYNVALMHVHLYHHESKSRGFEDTTEKQERFLSECVRLQNCWGSLLSKDPFYNPNLTLDREDFSIKQ